MNLNGEAEFNRQNSRSEQSGDRTKAHVIRISEHRNVMQNRGDIHSSAEACERVARDQADLILAQVAAKDMSPSVEC